MTVLQKELVVGILKHQPDPPADLGCVAIVDLQAVDPDIWSPTAPAVARLPSAMVAMTGRPPGLTRQEPVQVQEQRALARAVGPDQGDRLARRERSIRRREARPCRRDSGTPGR